MVNLKGINKDRKPTVPCYRPFWTVCPSRHKIALQISLCLSKRSKFTWLERLPVTQEAAPSSPVAPAKFCCITRMFGLLVLSPIEQTPQQDGAASTKAQRPSRVGKPSRLPSLAAEMTNPPLRRLATA